MGQAISSPSQARGWRAASEWACALIAVLVLAAGAGRGAQSPTENPESPWEKYLVPDAPEPTFRFPVAHEHGLGSWARFCSGFLVVSRGEIAYEVLRPAENRDHSFKVPRVAILEVGKWRGLGPAAAAELKFGNKLYHFYLTPLKTLDKDPHHLLMGSDVLPWPPVSQIFTEFNDAVARIERRRAALQKKEEAKAQPAAPKPAEKPAEATGPQVRIMEPAATDPTTPIEVEQPVIALRGAALDPKGVLSIQVNGRQAELKAIGDITAMEFSVEDLKLQPGLNRISVVASNTEKRVTQLPVLLWLRSPKTAPEDPAAPGPAPETSTRAGGRALSEGEILDLVQNYVPGERIISFVERYGIDFEPTGEYCDKLRKLGARDALIEALQKAKRVKPAPKEQATTPR